MKLLSQTQAEAAMDVRRDDGIPKVIRNAIAFPAKIKPSLRILMDEEGRE
jgi:hypothetical protein